MGLGLSGIAQISSAGFLDFGQVNSTGTSTTYNLRVFDVAIAGTSNAAFCAILCSSGAGATSAISSQVVAIRGATLGFLHSSGGYRFISGNSAHNCFVIATNCTATVNYIKEF